MYEFDSPFFVLRTPLLTYNNFEKLINHKDEISIADIHRIIDANEYISEAMYLASDDFFLKLKEANDDLPEKDKKSLIASFVAYYIRMTSRCTPFGLFASNTIGEWSTKTIINVSENSNLQRHLRIDHEFLGDLVENLLSNKNFSDKLTYYSNNTIYQVGKSLRFYEKKTTLERSKFSEKQKYYDLVTVEKNNLLLEIIKRSKTGISFKDLSLIVTSQGYSDEIAREYLFELIDSHVLYSELEPHISGTSFLTKLLEKLKQKEGDLTIFQEISNEIAAVNNISLDSELPCSEDFVAHYKKLSELLRRLHSSSNLGRNLLQLDTYRTGKEVCLNRKLIRNLVEGIKICKQLNNNEKSHTDFAKFERAFYDRYENQIVPLVVALDSEIGLGYSNQLKSLSNRDFYAQKTSNYKFNRISQLKLDLYTHSLRTDSYSVDLNDNSLMNEIPKNQEEFPNELCSLISIHSSIKNYDLNKNEEKIIHLKYATRSSSIRFLGRFSYQDEIKSKIDQLVNYEEKVHSDKIIAEIVHFPKDRIGNIAIREKLRKYEIPIVTPSLLDPEQQLLITDLHLLFRDGRLILWSKKHNKEVIPRLSVAHNYNFRSLGVYHFLCDYQYNQEELNLQWNWEHLSYQESLPRVMYKNIVLSPKIWNIHTTGIKLLKLSSNTEKRNYLDNLRKRLKIPKTVMLKSDENNLILNLDNIDCINILIKRFKKYEMTTLVENLWEGDSMVAESNEGNYTNEVIVPLLKNNPIKSNNNHLKNYGITEFLKAKTKVQRTFAPGSSWYYAKIYLPNVFLEELLIELYSKVIQPLKKSNSIKNWFFIRYRDPQYHLRIRIEIFDIKNFTLINEQMNKVCSKYIETGQIQKFSLDIYERELERFGSNNIASSEQLFCASSELTLKLLKLLNNTSYSSNRFLFCMLGVELIFKSFQLSASERQKQYQHIYNSFETGLDKNQKFRIADYTRSHLKNDLAIMAQFSSDSQKPIPENFDKIIILFKKESRNLEKICASIKSNLQKDHLSFEDKLSIYSHLYINRIINNGTLFWEPLTYYHLSKIMTALIARNLIS